MQNMQDFKCPCCSGAIEWNSNVQKMKCPYCETEFEMEALNALNESAMAEQPDNMEWNTQAGTEWSGGEAENMSVYICESCGAEIVTDRTTAATTCPYCDNNIVMRGNVSGGLKPDMVIPFKLDKKAAKAGFEKHLKGKRLLPKIFRDENHIDEVKGVYVPFWLFDADANANIRFLATRTKTWSDSEYVYRKTSYYNVLRGGNISFANIPVDGSSQMDDDLMDSIEPFNMAEAVDFNTAYLSGYLADKYDVDADQSIGRANLRIKNSTEEAFRKTVQGYTTVTTQSSSVNTTNGRTRYALFPVWILNTTYKDKKYTFAMNGQTGKFVGNLPICKNLLFKYLATSFVGVSAIATLISFLIML